VDGFSFAFWRGLSPPCADRPSRCLYVRLRTFAYVCGVRCQPLTRCLCAVRDAWADRCGAASLLGAVAPAPLLRAVFRLGTFSGFVGC
jgi:hypothetical protein